MSRRCARSATMWPWRAAPKTIGPRRIPLSTVGAAEPAACYVDQLARRPLGRCGSGHAYESCEVSTATGVVPADPPPVTITLSHARARLLYTVSRAASLTERPKAPPPPFGQLAVRSALSQMRKFAGSVPSKDLNGGANEIIDRHNCIRLRCWRLGPLTAAADAPWRRPTGSDNVDRGPRDGPGRPEAISRGPASKICRPVSAVPVRRPKSGARSAPGR